MAFLLREASDPNLDRWLKFGVDEETKEAAAFSALLLANLLTKKAAFTYAGERAYEAFVLLSGGQCAAPEYERWLRKGWLNVSRVANALSAELRKPT